MECNFQKVFIGFVWVILLGYGVYDSFQKNQNIIGSIMLITLVLGVISLILIKENPVNEKNRNKINKIPIYN